MLAYGIAVPSGNGAGQAVWYAPSLDVGHRPTPERQQSCHCLMPVNAELLPQRCCHRGQGHQIVGSDDRGGMIKRLLLWAQAQAAAAEGLRHALQDLDERALPFQSEGAAGKVLQGLSRSRKALERVKDA